jgi:hypothetical protein
MRKLRKDIGTGNKWAFYLTYTLADQLSVGKLKSALMDDIFRDLSDSFFTPEAAIYLFDHLPSNDPILQLAVDTFCVNGGVEGMDDES